MRIKYVLLAVAGLFVAVLAGGYIYLSTLDLEALKARAEAEVEKATGRQLTIAGPVDLAIGLQPAIAVEQVTLSNADWGSRAEMVTLERFELELALLPLLSGDVQVNRIVLVRPDILVETNPAGEGNWAMGPAAPGTEAGTAAEAEPAAPDQPAESGEAPLIPRVVAVEIEEGQLVFRDGVTEETLTLDLESLVVRQADGGQELDLAATFQGAEIALSGTTGAVDAVLAGGDFPVDISGTVAGNQVSISGVVGTPMSAPAPDLTLSLQGESLDSFAPLAGGAELPPLGPFSLEGRLVTEGQSYGLEDLNITVGGSDMRGSLSADLSGDRPRVTVDLTSSVIDLQDFQAGDGAGTDDGTENGTGAGGAEGEAGAPAPAGESPYVIPDTPLPLDVLRTVDASAQVAAGVVRLDPGLEITDVTVGVTLDGGNLQIAPLQAGYQQSRMEGQVGLDASGETPRLATQITVDELDFGQMLNDQGITEDVQGTMDIRIDLTGSGASPRAIASSLNGTTDLVNEGGRISNRLLAILGAGFTQVLGPLLGGEDTTALNCIVSRFEITDGLAESRAMVLDTASFSLAGGGNVDLRSEELDLTFDTASRVPSLVSLAIPFRVQGTMKNPSVVPDPVGALRGVAGAAATIANPLAVLGAVAGGSVVGGGDQAAENPCLTALDPDAQAEAGGEPTGGAAVPEAVEGAGDALRDGAEGAGEAIEEGVDRLRNLFDN
ncbi:AsmA family protein [Algihabitans albus]|uniref:AsmA family protein n=1 Tax=Algihabitans albus TaxID=2164067 RepID=UPI000E5CD38F|nr:AsmA family protein [Algihabitans albus]